MVMLLSLSLVQKEREKRGELSCYIQVRDERHFSMTRELTDGSTCLPLLGHCCTTVGLGHNQGRNIPALPMCNCVPWAVPMRCPFPSLAK